MCNEYSLTEWNIFVQLDKMLTQNKKSEAILQMGILIHVAAVTKILELHLYCAHLPPGQHCIFSIQSQQFIMCSYLFITRNMPFHCIIMYKNMKYAQLYMICA